MKRIILLLAFVAGIGLAANAQKPAEFTFETNVHAFGKIQKNKPATYEFKFVNTGDVPLIIKDATAQCGCTTPVLLPAAGTPIKKGEKGTVKVTFNAATDGPFTKLVTISSNAATSPTVLTIKGEVVAATSTSTDK